MRSFIFNSHLNLGNKWTFQTQPKVYSQDFIIREKEVSTKSLSEISNGVSSVLGMSELLKNRKITGLSLCVLHE